MAFQKVVIRPGVNADFTPTLNEAGWSFSNLIRFKDKLAQKLGGWQRLTSTPFTGSVRGVHAWNDLSGNSYYAGGSEQRLEVWSNGAMTDITPIRQTDNPAVSLTTNITSGTANQVAITDAGNGAANGDWVNVVIPISVGPPSSGNPVLWGPYQVTGVSGSSYLVTASSNATSVATNTGAVPLFTTTSGLTYVKVTLNNHGYQTGQANAGYFNIQLSTTVAGITMLGTYQVITSGSGTSGDKNNFYIQPGSAATTNSSGSENGGNAQLQYLLTNGLPSNAFVGGYGFGGYGSGSYGMTSTGSVPTALRTWYLDNYGQNLVGNYNGSTLYQWAPPVATYAGEVMASNPATAVSGAPTGMNVSFVSNPQQMVIALGVWNSGTSGMVDPNLVGWCDAGNINTWIAASSNQAGTYRIPTGSKLVGGMVMSNQVLIWTDLDLWTMQYLGLPFVWGFQKVSTECGLISGKAMGVLGQQGFWMGYNNFFLIGPGGATVLPCPVWDIVFKNLSTTQQNKVFCAVNSYFQEVAWYFPSASGSGEIDTYVKYNAQEQTWDYGSLVRLAWADANVFGSPIGIDANGLMQQHEVAIDADGSAMMESIQSGYFDIGDGEMYVFIERMIPDFDFAGSTTTAPNLQITVYFLEYPNDANNGIGPVSCGPFTITNKTQVLILRGRSRQASLKIQGMGLGTVWRIGAVRHNGQQDGRR